MFLLRGRTAVVYQQRTRGLIVTEAGAETIVYDEETKQVHSLNSAFGTVWSLCDGTRTESDIIVATGMTTADVRDALGQLSSVRLLQGPTADRRAFLKKAGASAGIGIGAIITVAAPAAAAAATGDTTTTTVVEYNPVTEEWD
jgi:hypothetical protein